MPSAMVLCAGFGGRLRPLTEELPKPLVPVGDRSILQHALGALASAGFDAFVINVHHLAGVFERALRELEPSPKVVVESEIRGTAGGVFGARHWLAGGPALIWNGDILVTPPFAQLLVGCLPQSLSMAVAPRPLGEGTVGVDDEGRVVRLRGERFGRESRGADYVGVMALSAERRAALPESGCLIADVALPYLRSGGRIASAPVTGAWTDAGDAQGLLAANLRWLRERELQAFAGEGSEVGPGVELRASVVGARSRVFGTGVVERCVVCPGARTRAPLSDAIVAPSGRVIPIHA